MVEKISTTNDNLRKQDLELMLEANRKAIEIETEVAEQNEEIIAALTDIKKTVDANEEKIDTFNNKIDDIAKDLFKIQVLFISGLISLVIQVIQIFIKK